MVAREVLEDHGLTAWPKTSGRAGFHIYARIAPHWPFKQVRLAAETVAREVERRAPELATSRWWKEERGRACSSTSTRTPRTAPSPRPTRCGATPDARVSTPLTWDEVPGCRPEAFTVATVPARFAEMRRPVGGDGRRGRIARRAAAAGRGARACREAAERRQQMPLIEIARTKTRDEAMAALDVWRSRHPQAAGGAAAGRRPRRRHARAQFDLVPDPDQPAARAGGSSGRRRRS